MSVPVVAAAGPRSGGALRALTTVALGDPPGTMAEVAAVLGRATGSRGVVLWEAPRAGPLEVGALSVLCAWRSSGATPVPDRADSVTREAYGTRTLALASAGGPSLLGLAVDAALPFEFPDGSGGVLTLCGAETLDGSAFDAAAELLEVVPQVLTVLRERATLGLVNACSDILDSAEVESGSEPLPRERLAGYVEAVCARVSQAMAGLEVSLYLEEPGCEGRYGLLAGWPAATRDRSTSLEAGDLALPGCLTGGQHVDQPVTSGTHLWGVLRCTSPGRPPNTGVTGYCCGQADLSVLPPVAAQLARYWATWLNRRALSEENRSWRDLATGITDFNEVLADALRRGESPSEDGWTVDEAALRVAAAVVSHASGATVFSAAPVGKHKRPSLVVTARSGNPEDDSARHRLAEQAYRSGLQMAGPAATGVGGEDRWMLSTPIRVGHQSYGALTAEGVGMEPPANSAQVYDILSDQLGLYRHLARTMSQLTTTQRELQANLTAQAEVMEDLKHQLVSPLRAATDRTDLVLRRGRLDSRTKRELAAARGLCRKASRVAMSAGVFAALTKGQRPTARNELLGAGDLQRLLIAAADDCRILSNPELRRSFEVDRTSLNALGKVLVQADSSFLQQCFGNLLDNADKYSYPQTEVLIAAGVTDRQLRITITSTGVPLAAEDRGNCLERSWRGPEARNSTGEGSGIGLWIVDNLMRSMRGRVEVQPTGHVLTIGLVLPTA